MIELLERQKKLTANQWKLICTANLADLLDFFDLFLIGYVTAALTKEWSLTYWQGGAIRLLDVPNGIDDAVASDFAPRMLRCSQQVRRVDGSAGRIRTRARLGSPMEAIGPAAGDRQAAA